MCTTTKIQALDILDEKQNDYEGFVWSLRRPITRVLCVRCVCAMDIFMLFLSFCSLSHIVD